MKRWNGLFKQIFSFGIVGGTCFIIDFVLLIFLTDFVHIEYLISAAISFIISTVANYILSMRFVFVKRVEINRQTEVAVFFVMSLAGLLFTEMFMLIFVEMFSLHYIMSKFFTTLIVMTYNFISRKLFFERQHGRKG